MNLIEQIEGQSGEVLASSLLGYLLQRSPEMRASAVELLSEKSKAAPLLIRNRFSVEWETSTRAMYAVAAPEVADGRLDLCLEVDNAIVGIEVKLLAGFTEGQPIKYVDALASRATAMSAVPGRTGRLRALLVVLAPRGRQAEIEAHIRAQSVTKSRMPYIPVICWEDLLERMQHASSVDPAALFLLKELSEFVLRSVGVRKDFALMLPRLLDDFNSGYTPEQVEILQWLWPVFRPADDESLGPLRVRLNAARQNTQYVGYPYLTSAEGGYGWYGFVASRWVDGDRSGVAKFVVIAGFPVDGLVFRKVVLKTDFTNFNSSSAWEVPIHEKGWNDLLQWKRALEPLRQAVQERVRAQRRPMDGGTSP